MTTRKAGRFVRVLTWLFAIIVVLVLMLFAWIKWTVAHSDTHTLPARHGLVAVELYAPAGAPRPLLVGLGGSEGGNAWTRAMWKPQRDRFLDQGYALLAVGYFGTPHSPEHLDRISLDGIHAAILKAARDPRVDGRCIGLIGGSRGGELALLLASHYPDIHGVVALVPGSAVFPALTHAMNTPGFSLHDQPLPFVPVPWSAVPNLLVHDLRGAFDKMVANTAAMDAAAIPVERIDGPVLFVSASRDEFWPSRDMSDAMVARMKARGFGHPGEHLVVEGGHTEPLDEFTRIEAFLRENFAKDCR
jgi:pimeloyl-ACP methyl ester carboxylesterase